KLRTFLFAAENVAEEGEPLDLVPRERFSGVPEFYLLHVTSELDANDDKPGRAAKLDGHDDRLETGPDAALNLTRTGTVEMWFNVQGAGDVLDFGAAAWMSLLHKGGNTAGTRQYSLWLNENGRLVFASNDTNQVQSAINLIRPNEWYHVTGVMDRDHGTMRLYLNGELVGTNTIATTNAPGSNTSLYIGDRHGTDTLGGDVVRFKGSLDEVRVWNVVRTDSQIRHAHQRTVEADAQGLAAYWRFSEPEGTTFNDSADLTPNQIDERQLALMLDLEPGAPLGVDNQAPSVAHADGRALILPFGPGQYQIKFVGTLGQTLHVEGDDETPAFSAVSLGGQPVVMALGDIDGDSFDDAVVSIRDGVPDGQGGFRHYARVAFGTADGLDPAKYGLPVTLQLPSPILTGPAGLRATISGVGDVNADGFDDIAVSVPSNTPGESKVYLVFGRADWSQDNPEQDAGLVGEYFFLGGSVLAFPDFDDLEPDLERIDSQINFPNTAGAFSGVSDADTFAVRWTGQINIETPGTYTFFLGSDDGSRLYIDNSNEPVVDNGGLHPFQEKSGLITLDAGLHEIRVEYFENFGFAGVQLSWDPPGAAGKQLVPGSVLFRNSRDVLSVASEGDVLLEGFSGAVQAIGAGDVTPVIGQGLNAQVFDLVPTGIAPVNELLSFDGANDVVTIASTPSLTPASQVTIEARIRVDAFTNQFMTVVTKGDATPFGRSYELFVRDDGGLLLVSSDGSDAGQFLNTAAGLVTQGVWYEVAAVVDRGAGTQKIYLDGAEVGSLSVPTTDLAAHDSPLLFGNWLESFATVSPFQGRIDEVAVWGTARTQGEIVADFEGIDPAAAGLAGHWKLNEASGDAVLDASPNGNDGVLGDGIDLSRNPARVAIFTQFPDFETLTPAFEFVDSNIIHFLEAENFGGSELDSQFAVVWTGHIRIDTAGDTTFALGVDDRARLFIDGAETPLIDFFTPPTGTVDLEAGLHSIRVEYLAGAAPSTIFLFWDSQDDADTDLSLIDNANLVRVDATFTDPTAAGTDDLLIRDAGGVRVVHGRVAWEDTLTGAAIDDTFTTGGAIAALGDINRDGRDDVAVIDGTELRIYRGGGALPEQLLEQHSITGLPAGVKVYRAGDIDGDAAQDILVTGANGSTLIFGGDLEDDQALGDLVDDDLAIELGKGDWRPIGDFDGPGPDGNTFDDLGAAVLLTTDKLNETGQTEHQAVSVFLGGARGTLVEAFAVADIVFEPGRASFTDPGEATPDATFFGSLGLRTGTDGESRALLGISGPAGDALRLYDGERLGLAEGTEETPGLENEPDLWRFE
ncbi:MAG TPA: LamG-like jellyroll fold domain-containing protein, partial [Steroidobacteraceae bacterium]|nr:LamG-like jellyroll fold domain-containing protein [Steroidobacteraceae bacterium]